ncbi:ATP-binding cassette domain-containing protein [Ornithinimicrobium sp. INDO-MA30-4]|uniref:ATP-binding cassette domain-containing protein n=1 Tax=Ornithinimicrobium sp. INDO-MA30-4 TaxID=2908651 RepID=UPI001F465C5B|nr:ATP-binding cassette domain-containing protein [Ornithinimicrobium sp. INDO-MA30-4]UJH69653.1 ATP-binding cassette domain-containing protein [Ornithinimicrobium sp. INDO-MA30-4]
MSGYGITTTDLSVRYGKTTALEAVNLDLAPGRIHGLLGRNGTGKTTLLSVLASLRQPHTGSVVVDGQNPSSGNP